jgi:hypothetical protein
MMASFKTQKVPGDVGSQQVAQLIHSYNHLLDILGTLITGLKTAANIGAQQTLATTAEASLELLVHKQEQIPNIPLSPAPPAA